MIQRLIESRSGNSSYWEQGREIQDRTRCHLHNPEHRQPCLGNSRLLGRWWNRLVRMVSGRKKCQGWRLSVVVYLELVWGRGRRGVHKADTSDVDYGNTLLITTSLEIQMWEMWGLWQDNRFGSMVNHNYSGPKSPCCISRPKTGCFHSRP